MRPWDIGRVCSLAALDQPSFWACSLSHASACKTMSYYNNVMDVYSFLYEKQITVLQKRLIQISRQPMSRSHPVWIKNWLLLSVPHSLICREKKTYIWAIATLQLLQHCKLHFLKAELCRSLFFTCMDFTGDAVTNDLEPDKYYQETTATTTNKVKAKSTMFHKTV